MNSNSNRPVAPSGQGISLGDIYYIIFRHKWKIVLAALAGLLAAGLMYRVGAPLYQSQAELLVKYVTESTAIQGDSTRVIVPDPDNEVVNSEIKILTSLDVAEMTASNFGPSTILAKAGGPVSAGRAAAYLHANLQAEPADDRSSVILVTLKHPDPRIVQPLLQEVINAYLEKHYEIHSAGGQIEEALVMEKSALSVQLNATEQQLADLKNKYDIISVEDAQKDLNQQLSRVHGEIQDAQADLSADEAAMKENSATQPADAAITNRAPAAIPQNEIDAYADICANLDSFRKKEQDYLGQSFTRSNSLLQNVEQEITVREKEKEALEMKYPGIAGLAPVESSASGSGTTTGVTMDPRLRLDEMIALKAKIRAWQGQLAKLQTQATNLNNVEPMIVQLQQTESILQENYQNLSTSLEKTHIDEALDTSKSPNIRPVQAPSPPARDWKKTYKAMGMAAFGGIFGGLAWAFLIEMVLDRSVKRAVEVEKKLKLPLFLSIPDVKRNGYAGFARTSERRQLAFNGGAAAGAEKTSSDLSKSNGNGHASLEQNATLQMFHRALRDRLILYFDVKGFTHKPKLVAVTGAGRGTGVSTVASGLAASLSEIGDGNVLLVDMNMENGAAQQFYKGKACFGLDTVLTSETKQKAMVQDNLYVVNGNADAEGLPQALPKRFTALVPKLKASEYDYIIFDMPVVSPTSVTSHLARFMDITLLVIESEKTSRDAAEQANARLVEVGASVGVVLNKTRQYVPKQLHQE